MDLKFERVTGSDPQVRVLYDLLHLRRYSISHKQVPPFEEHRDFVNDHPYRVWFLIKASSDYIGSVYVKDDNSIGLNLDPVSVDSVQTTLEFIRTKMVPMPAKASLVPDYFYINVAASNEALLRVLDKVAVKKLQVSYRL